MPFDSVPRRTGATAEPTGVPSKRDRCPNPLRTDAARGRNVAPGKLTVGEWLLGEWLESRQNADISPNTLDTDRTVVESWIVPRIGGISLQRLSARDLDRLYKAAGEWRTGRTPLRGKSVRNAHTTLHKALSDAVRRDTWR